MSAKVIIISGPIKGATFFLQQGENIIGRASNAAVVLPHSQVSKKHAVLSVFNNAIELIDAGSANGTFVNGVLVKKRNLKHGDRLTVGPFVIEILVAKNSSQALVQRGATAFATANDSPSADFAALSQNAEAQAVAGLGQSEQSKSLVVKMLRRFDEVVLPVLYDFNKSYEWLTLAIALFALFLIVNMGMTVYPLMDAAKESVLRETRSKVQYIAKQITHINGRHLLEATEARLDVSFAEVEPAVKEALVVNLEGRILAPGNRLNELYNDPFFLKYRDRIRRGDQRDWHIMTSSGANGVITVLDPIMTLSKSKSMNVPGAVSVVKYSIAGIALDAGTVGVIYLEALVMSAFIGAIFLYLLFRLTVHPLRLLNDEMDSVLKGNLDAVEKKFKFEGLNELVDTINAAISRIPKTDNNEMAGPVVDDKQARLEAIQNTAQFLGPKLRLGVLLTDSERHIRYMNQQAEETTGLHLSNSQGEVIEVVCRDEALSSLMRELLDRSPAAGLDGVTEEYEFGSGSHQVSCFAFSSTGGIDGYLISIEKTGE